MDDKTAIKTIKKVMPAVVSIVISKRLEDVERETESRRNEEDGARGKGKTPDASRPAPHAQFLADKNGMVEVGGGSGFIVDENGLVLTNKHVIAEPGAAYTVVLNDGRKFPAQLMSRDPINDLAIMKIDAVKLPRLELGDATRLELGTSVIAIGNALGMFKNTVSLGIVSGLSRSITAQAEPNAPIQELRGLIQTDAAINPGNSGGPLVDKNGKVIGVNSAIVSGAQSIGFAIPVNAARRDLEDIKKYGRIHRPLLGLRYVMVDDDLKEKMGLPVNYGAIVVRESERDYAVAPGSPADLAGIKEKDIVLTLNGARLDRDHPVQDFLEELNVGDVVILHALRAGKEFTAKATLTERK
jgi:serine protease Do